ncbi:MAG: hypothetical protein H7235_01325 [Bdellovibrionaceae bacterium]|nr:hypothetical protein [Pseudobdellovibrionaceae bacterium]
MISKLKRFIISIQIVAIISAIVLSAATRTRTKSILQMSDGICSEGNSSMSSCLKGVFEHFSKTAEATGVQFIPITGEAIQVGMDPTNFTSIPLPTGKEIVRVGRGLDREVYVVVRATTEKGEIRRIFFD